MGYVRTTILNFILWGSGTFLERRERLQLLPVLLHVYLYGIALLLFASPIVWIIFVPVLGLGGAYFTLNVRREQASHSETTIRDRGSPDIPPELVSEFMQIKEHPDLLKEFLNDRDEKPPDELMNDLREEYQEFSQHFCTSCGKKVPSRARFCSNCGESQGRQ